MSQVLNSPMTTLNQTFLTNNKRALSRFFGTVALTSQPRFYLYRFNQRKTRNTGARSEMCLKLTVKVSERRQRHCSGVFIVNTDFTHWSGISIGDFEQVYAGSVDEL